MIINIDRTSRFSLVFNLFKNLKVFALMIRFKHLEKRAFSDGIKLKKLFKSFYPELVKDSVGNTVCTSCKLCEEVCPTDAIQIDKANMVNFPSTLETGEAPLKFNLKVDDCVTCGLCVTVCYVDAIILAKKYNESKVDLVSVGNN